jgi:IrrE N-terminal-like domain
VPVRSVSPHQEGRINQRRRDLVVELAVIARCQHAATRLFWFIVTTPAAPAGANRHRHRPHRRPAGSAGRVGTAGYTYQERELDGANPDRGTGTLGYTDPTSRTIVVDPRLTDHQKAIVIAHELGHLHTGHVDSSPQEYRRHRGQWKPRPTPKPL